MFKEYWSCALSLITVLVSIFALIQSYRQTSLNNKQHLFDKRMENYMIAAGLIELYRKNYSNLNCEGDEPFFLNDLVFIYLTNNTYLEHIAPAIKEPLKDPSHTQLLIKLENLKDVATKIKFLFSGKTAKLLGNFVLNYKELLFRMYQYQIVLSNMSKISQKFQLTLKECQKKCKEKEHRITLQEAFTNLKESEIMLREENVEKLIENQIMLVQKKSHDTIIIM